MVEENGISVEEEILARTSEAETSVLLCEETPLEPSAIAQLCCCLCHLRSHLAFPEVASSLSPCEIALLSSGIAHFLSCWASLVAIEHAGDPFLFDSWPEPVATSKKFCAFQNIAMFASCYPKVCLYPAAV